VSLKIVQQPFFFLCGVQDLALGPTRLNESWTRGSVPSDCRFWAETAKRVFPTVIGAEGARAASSDSDILITVVHGPEEESCRWSVAWFRDRVRGDLHATTDFFYR